jgi:hypothetical protein
LRTVMKLQNQNRRGLGRQAHKAHA